METRDVGLKIKALEDGGEFTGLAAVYDERDLQDDVIVKGAFRAAIANQGNGYPVLWAHNQAEPVGIARIEDSPSALMVHGSIDRSDPEGERAYQRAKKGLVRGLSIGFTIPRGEGKVSYENGVRYLREVRLHELSLVSVPAQPGARIVTVKSLDDVQHVLRQLARGDIEPDLLEQLHGIDRELKQLLATADPDRQDNAVLLNELKALTNDVQAFKV